MIRYGAALAALTAALALGACGGGGSSSQFASKAQAACEKDGGQSKEECTCGVAILDKELDDKTKSLFLVMMDEELRKDPAKAKEAMEKAGLKQEDAMALMGKLSPLMERVEKECKKK
jgi:hypothetical protein